MSQGLAKISQLNQTQIEAVRQLSKVCNRFDGLTMKQNWNRLRNRPDGEINDFLYFDKGDLVGFLALYVFNPREVEISAMTAPGHRQRGIFQQLLAAARKEVSRRNIPELLFICERPSKPGSATMQAIGATYDFSEYKMLLRKAVQPVETGANLQLRPATLADIPLMANLDELCFGVPVGSTVAHLQTELSDTGSKKGSIVTLNGENIGKILTTTSGQETYIVAFCIRPEHQRKGYGKAILSRTVSGLVAKGHQNIVLEVETKNEQALTLYKNCGFKTVTAYDYYRLPT